jgi:DNA-binding NtrC family response regulator
MTRIGVRRGAKRALVVDPDPAFTSDLALRLRPYSKVTTCSAFPQARARLRELKPQLLVTALALQEYNGLHLVYLASGSELQTCSIVYCTQLDVGLAAEVQAAGAFFELRHRMPTALPLYAAAMTLPSSDRRTVTRPDRRTSPRGGRRATDLPFESSA